MFCEAKKIIESIIMAGLDMVFERKTISDPTIDYISFSKSLFASDVEGQQLLSTLKRLPLQKCLVISKKGHYEQLQASYKYWDKLDKKQLGNAKTF